MTMTLSISASKTIFSCFPACSRDLLMICIMPLYSVSYTSVDFPLPETPVTTVRRPIGNFAVMFLRLFSVQPLIVM